MRDHFYMVLPSDSSMRYFPDNTTTHFVTQLPQPIRLIGRWVVALTEIQIPQTLLHVSSQESENVVSLTSDTNKIIDGDENLHFGTDSIFSGVYTSVNELLSHINNTNVLREHLKFILLPGGRVSVKRICKDCSDIEHYYELPMNISRILGIPNKGKINAEKDFEIIGKSPASLSADLPNILFVYTDICEPYITGDVQTPLLRIVPMQTENYWYGSIKTRSFSPAKYIPLLHTNFQTIEIDIRDHLGNPIPFECGTLTVTLHFKCID